MGWGIAIAAAIGAASTAYSANQAKSAQEDQAALLAGADEDIFGTKPEEVDWTNIDYVPSYEDGGYGATQKRTISDNLGALNVAQALADKTNAGITASNMNRIETWAPGFTGNVALANSQAGQLLGGNVPADVVRAIQANTAGVEATTGTAGTSGADINRNLGLTSMENISAGLSLLGGVTDITGSVDPLSMQMLPQSMFISPSDAINWTIQENQFDWNANFQNAVNQYSADVNNSLLQASADPTASGLFQLQYANLGGEAQVDMQTANNYAALASSVAQAYGKSNSGYNTGYTGGTGSGYSNWSTNTSQGAGYGY